MKLKISEFDKKTELENCNFVKTILMICVVVYHSMLFWTGSWFIGEPVFQSNVLAIISKWLNTFHIYAFTLVSGYIYYFIKFEQKRYTNFLPFMTNKVKRLLIPYCFVSIMWVIPISNYFFHYDIEKIFKNFVLGISPGQLWFVLMLFNVFILVYLFDEYLVNRDFGLIIALGLYFVGGIGKYCSIPNIYQIFDSFRYIVFFVVGCFIRKKGSDIIRNIPCFVWFFVDVLLFAMKTYIDESNIICFKLIGIGLDFVVCMTGAIMAFVILQKVADSIKWKENKLIKILESYSMPVYLFHQQMIYIFVFFFNGLLNPYIHTLVNFISSLFFSIVLSAVLMKYKRTRILIGEK